MDKKLSSFYYIWIPAAAVIIQIFLELSLSGNVLSILHSENGPYEILQAVIVIVGFFVSIWGIKSKKVKGYLLNIWFFLAMLSCFYVAGEELSWGQHIFDWATPEFWTEVNDQQETNLHNTSSWFDQKPRLILLIGIVFGTLIYPVLKTKKIITLPHDLDFLFPSAQLKFLALLIFIPHILEKIFAFFDIVLYARFSEVEELYMFYFVLLYLIMLQLKLSKQNPTK